MALLLVIDEEVNFLDNISQLVRLSIDISLEGLKAVYHVPVLFIGLLVILIQVQHVKLLLILLPYLFSVGALRIFRITVKREEIGKFGPLPLLTNLSHDAHHYVFQAIFTEKGPFILFYPHLFGYANDVIAGVLSPLLVTLFIKIYSPAFFDYFFFFFVCKASLWCLEKLIFQNVHCTAEGLILVLFNQFL